MDPLSLTASIIAVVDVGVEISTQLSRLARKMKNAGKEVAEIADEINSLSSAVQNLHLCLKEGMHRGEPVYSECMVVDIEHLLKRIEVLHEETWELLPGKRRRAAKDKQVELNVLDCFKWIFKSSKAREIMKKMDSLKSTLSVMMTTLQLALQQKLIS